MSLSTSTAAQTTPQPESVDPGTRWTRRLAETPELGVVAACIVVFLAVWIDKHRFADVANLQEMGRNLAEFGVLAKMLGSCHRIALDANTVLGQHTQHVDRGGKICRRSEPNVLGDLVRQQNVKRIARRVGSRIYALRHTSCGHRVGQPQDSTGSVRGPFRDCRACRWRCVIGLAALVGALDGRADRRRNGPVACARDGDIQEDRRFRHRSRSGKPRVLNEARRALPDAGGR